MNALHQAATPAATHAATEPMRPFRPLFFMAALYAALAAIIWLVVLQSTWIPGITLTLAQWHEHELVFGFGGALVSGFLLTATAHWTGVATVTPWALAALCVLWLAARVGFFAGFPLAWTAALDLAWLALLNVCVCRAIVRKRSRNHYVVIALVGSYLALDAAFFGFALAGSAMADRALVWGVDWITMLMLVIGGRIIPYFSTVVPQVDPAYRYGRVVGIGAALALLLDVGGASAGLRGAWWIIIALFTLSRLEGWHGWRCAREPMLWSLHLGYLWLVIGMFVRGVALLANARWEPATLGLITIGALGTLSLSMMTRLSQGRSRSWIRANGALVIAFLLPSLAAILWIVPFRVATWISAALWIIAWLIYLAVIGPLLIRGKAIIE
ncbi:MAG TPA: NnrS family protein [Nevskiaceae bacterium]